MRRFKKLCEKEGLVKDIKRKEFFEKPSERNRRDMRKAISKRIREALPPSVREKMREEKKKKFGGGGGRGGYGGGGGDN
jgi:small subunit ribosomal protein S21